MAAFRKSCLRIIENEGENSDEGQFSIQIIDEDDGEDLHDRTSTGNETGEEAEDDDEADKALAQELQEQGSATLKRNKAGRKSCWPEEAIDEVVNVICEKEYYRKRLIFKNNKASKNLEIYSKIVNEVKAHFNERGTGSFEFTPIQTRTKFKSCVAICKKALMTRKCGSGIANFMDQKPAWIQTTVPFC